MLPEVTGDPRTVHKLFTRVPGAAPTNGGDGGHSGMWDAPPTARKPVSDVWLSPWTPNSVNEIELVFDAPVAVSLLRLCNYAKDPARGVDDFELLADGLLVYRGRLQRSGGPASAAEWQSVVLTNEPMVCQAEHDAGRIFFSGAPEHAESSVMLINDAQVVKQGNSFSAHAPAAAAPGARPKTSCPPALDILTHR